MAESLVELVIRIASEYEAANFKDSEKSEKSGKSHSHASLSSHTSLISQPAGLQNDPGTELVAPLAWFERAVPAYEEEPAYGERCVARRGISEQRGAVFVHFCCECGRWGTYGYGVGVANPGRWYCREHRPREDGP